MTRLDSYKVYVSTMRKTKWHQGNVRDDQHILSDKEIIKQVVGAVELSKDDVVLEIGGGSGNLTNELAKQSDNVIVIEKDGRFVEALHRRFERQDNVSIISGDVLKVDIPKFNKIVANMPYSVLQQLLIKFIRERKQNFDIAVLVVPHGFARKLTSSPSSDCFGEVSAMAMAFYDVEVLRQIDKESFAPAPRVTSECIRLRPAVVGTPGVGVTRRMLQNLFLYNEKKVKNCVMQTLWDEGEKVIGRKLAKKEATELADHLLSELPDSLTAKRMAQLSDGEIRELVVAISKWQDARSHM